IPMDFSLPPVGEGLYEVELIRWLVRPGDAVSPGQGLMEVMSDKATMEVPAPFVGTITGLAAEPGSKVKVGQVVLTYNPVGETSGGRQTPERASSPAATSSSLAGLTSPARPRTPPTRQINGTGRSSAGPVVAPPAAPSVRLLARKLGVDLARVRGSGPHGRILLDDLTPFLTPRSTDRAAKPEKAGKT